MSTMAESSPFEAAIRELEIAELFSKLPAQQKLYAHHLSRAAWHGARVVMRQTSPESIGIFNFILDLHKACDGQWKSLVDRCAIPPSDVDGFLEYAALFLCNEGNFYGEGNQKIVPNVSRSSLWRIASISASATETLESIVDSILSVPPSNLGFPDTDGISNYYPGSGQMSRQEIANVSKILEKHAIGPENTRVRKVVDGANTSYQVLQASADVGASTELGSIDGLDGSVRVMTGDHSQELVKVCSELTKAREYAANDIQATVLDQYIESFKTGSLDVFHESQKLWVTDKTPDVEHMMGFVEPYRDPFGVRAEWGAVICITDRQETARLTKIVHQAPAFIHLLPWSVEGVNGGMGPFEKPVFEPPEFTSVQALAFCASTVWGAANLPNYHDIRETCGIKNVVIGNCMSANHDPASPCHYVRAAEVDAFKKCMPIVRLITTAIHGILGHGTGKLLSETAPGEHNFDTSQPPINPLTNESVKTWYKPGQTWTGVFEEIAMSVEETRATLISEYLIDNKEMLAIFGYDDSTQPTADEIIYNTYMQIGVEGLQALEYFSVKDQTWGEAHKRGHFAILKYLVTEGNGVLTVEHDLHTKQATVHVDRSKILSDGKTALGRILCRLHIWRCVADVEACKEFYESLTEVTGIYEEWRQIVSLKPEPRWKFVQPNTFVKGEVVEIKTYEVSNEGIIQSWVDRNV